MCIVVDGGCVGVIEVVVGEWLVSFVVVYCSVCECFVFGY